MDVSYYQLLVQIESELRTQKRKARKTTKKKKTGNTYRYGRKSFELCETRSLRSGDGRESEKEDEYVKFTL